MTSSAHDTALRSSNPRIGLYFRIGIEPPARLWMGVGDVRAAIDGNDVSPVPTQDVNADGAIYKGLGEVIGVPVFQQLINGAAERVELKLSGVGPRAVQLAASESDDVKGVPLLVGIGTFDDEWQMISQPTWIRRLVVDILTVEMQPSQEGVVHTISLSARSFMTGRRRPGLSYYTDREQQTRSPGDLFCNRTALYSVDAGKTWPQFN